MKNKNTWEFSRSSNRKILSKCKQWEKSRTYTHKRLKELHRKSKQIWGRKWQPTPVFLPGEFHGQRSLVGCSPWGCRESAVSKRLTLSLFSFIMITCVLSCLVVFATPWTVAGQAPLSMGFSRQEYWSRWLFPPLWNLPDSDQTHVSCIAGGSLYLSHPGSNGRHLNSLGTVSSGAQPLPRACLCRQAQPCRKTPDWKQWLL